MSRTKLQRILHVRVHDSATGPTIDVRFYSQSEGAVVTTCVGSLQVARVWWTEVLRPLLRFGARAAGIAVTIDVRPRGENRDRPTGAPSAPLPVANIPRLGAMPEKA